MVHFLNSFIRLIVSKTHGLHFNLNKKKNKELFELISSKMEFGFGIKICLKVKSIYLKTFLIGIESKNVTLFFH